MQLGGTMRALRQSKKMTIQDLAQKASVSASLISQVERERICPTVDTLWQISQALEVSIGYFFDEQVRNPNPVVRKHERKELVLAGSNALYELLSPNLKRQIEFLRVTIEPGEESQVGQISHEGEECGVVLQGTLTVRLGEEEHLLNEGDSIYFSSTIPHRYINSGKTTSVSYWAMTPPSF